MTKRILFGVMLFVTLGLGMFFAGSFTSFFENIALEDVEAYGSSLDNVSLSDFSEQENLAMPNGIYGELGAYIGSDIRIPNLENATSRAGETARKRSSQLLWFVVLFCTAFKRAFGGISAILLLCMIFISYFQIQIFILHQYDGKKWRPSFSVC